MDGEPKEAPGRIVGLDAYRGLIMLLMALDHASTFAGDGTHAGGEFWGGRYPRYDDPALLTARAVTHLCAPGFALLMGMGMALFARRRLGQGWSKPIVARHFALRGGLLALLQFGLENTAWRWGGAIPQDMTYFGVLSMLGAGMILCAPLSWRRPAITATLGLGTMILGWLLLPSPQAWGAPVPLTLRLLAVPGYTGHAMVLYPILPWLGVILMGLALGGLLDRDRDASLRGMALAGAALLAMYPLARLLGGAPLMLRSIPVNEWWSLFYLVKYPPSPALLMVTLGAALTAGPLLERIFRAGGLPGLDTLRLVGSTPLFFYLLHLWLYATLTRLALPDKTGLAGVLLLWLAGLALLVPASLAYARRRAARRGSSARRTD